MAAAEVPPIFLSVACGVKEGFAKTVGNAAASGKLDEEALERLDWRRGGNGDVKTSGDCYEETGRGALRESLRSACWV